MMKIHDLKTHPEKWATVEEVAEAVHASRSFVKKLVKAGTLERMETPDGTRLMRISIDSVRTAFPNA